MKKFSAVLICVLLVTSLVVMALATDSVQLTITPSKTEVARGEVIDFTISMSEYFSCRSGAVIVDYDKSVFEFVTGSGKCKISDAMVKSFKIVNGLLSGSFTFAEDEIPESVSGDIFTFKMKVLDVAAFENSAITLSAATFKTVSQEANVTFAPVEMTVVCTHNWSDWSENGTGHTRSCPICEATETADHAWNSGEITTAPTCYAAGVKTYTCVDCKATKTESVAQLTHKWDAGMVTKEATCAAEGVKTFACENGCGDTKTEVIAKTNDHKYGDWVNSGEFHKHTCSVCTKEEYAAHEAGTELIAGTSTHWNVCACGAKINETAHAYSMGAWEKDSENHWHACACGAKGDLGAHSYTEKLTDEAHKVADSAVAYYYDCAYCDAIGTETYEVVARGDMDKDGDVDENDAIYLLQHVLIPEMFPID